jgi:hypothetical protein
MLNGTWRTTQENSTTKRQWLCLGQVIRKPGVKYALPERGWGLPVVGV